MVLGILFLFYGLKIVGFLLQEVQFSLFCLFYYLFQSSFIDFFYFIIFFFFIFSFRNQLKKKSEDSCGEEIKTIKKII